jgi:hypothetical protein
MGGIMKPREQLARIHFVNTILHAITGRDLYLASQVLSGIEAASASTPAMPDDPAAFSGAIDHLHETLTGAEPDAGFTYVECASPESAGPLWVRECLLRALDDHADAPQAMVMIGNAAGADDSPVARTTKRKRSRARRRAADYASTIQELRDLALRRANPRSLVTLLFV